MTPLATKFATIANLKSPRFLFLETGLLRTFMCKISFSAGSTSFKQVVSCSIGFPCNLDLCIIILEIFSFVARMSTKTTRRCYVCKRPLMSTGVQGLQPPRCPMFTDVQPTQVVNFHGPPVSTGPMSARPPMLQVFNFDDFHMSPKSTRFHCSDVSNIDRCSTFTSLPRSKAADLCRCRKSTGLQHPQNVHMTPPATGHRSPTSIGF